MNYMKLVLLVRDQVPRQLLGILFKPAYISYLDPNNASEVIGCIAEFFNMTIIVFSASEPESRPFIF
jgi:hypothetical protein